MPSASRCGVARLLAQLEEQALLNRITAFSPQWACVADHPCLPRMQGSSLRATCGGNRAERGWEPGHHVDRIRRSAAARPATAGRQLNALSPKHPNTGFPSYSTYFSVTTAPSTKFEMADESSTSSTE